MSLLLALGTSTSLNINISGIQAGTSQGSVTTAGVTALIGRLATASQSAVTASTIASISGILSSSSAGSISLSGTIALTGQASSASQGLITLTGVVSLAGQLATTSQGTVVYSVGTSSLDLSISGIQSSAGIGNFSLSAVATVAGNLATASQGSVQPAVSLVVPGIQSAASLGTITPIVNSDLVGQQANTAQGIVTYTTQGTALELTLPGIQALTAQGTVTLDITGGTQSGISRLHAAELTERLLNLRVKKTHVATTQALMVRFKENDDGSISIIEPEQVAPTIPVKAPIIRLLQKVALPAPAVNIKKIIAELSTQSQVDAMLEISRTENLRQKALEDEDEAVLEQAILEYLTGATDSLEEISPLGIDEQLLEQLVLLFF